MIPCNELHLLCPIFFSIVSSAYMDLCLREELSHYVSLSRYSVRLLSVSLFANDHRTTGTRMTNSWPYNEMKIFMNKIDRRKTVSHLNDPGQFGSWWNEQAKKFTLPLLLAVTSDCTFFGNMFFANDRMIGGICDGVTSTHGRRRSADPLEPNGKLMGRNRRLSMKILLYNCASLSLTNGNLFLSTIRFIAKTPFS